MASTRATLPGAQPAVPANTGCSAGSAGRHSQWLFASAWSQVTAWSTPPALVGMTLTLLSVAASDCCTVGPA